MWVLLIAATLIGPSLNAVLNQTLRDTTTYMLGVRCRGVLVLEGDSENIDNNDGRVPENCTKDQQITRNFTRRIKMDLKALKIQYKRKCSNSSSVECVRLLRKLVRSSVQSKPNVIKQLRDLWSTLDFRLCLIGFDIVHYDTNTQLCCNGVFNKTSESEDCCRGDIIDTTKQFCCNDRIHNRTDSYECCGTYTFDTRIHICCNGILHPKLPGAACCGNDVFNKKTQICCFDTFKFNLTEGNACCGTSVYNMSSDTCCQNSVQPAYGRKNSKGACCKDRSYHAQCFRCENNTQLVAVFNESSEVCCDGKFRKKKYGNATRCCWRQVMDTERQLCYYKEIIDRLPSTQTATSYPEKYTPILLMPEYGPPSSQEQFPIAIIIVGCLTGVCMCAGCAALFVIFRHTPTKQALVNKSYSKSIGHDESEPTLSQDPENDIQSNLQTRPSGSQPYNEIQSNLQTWPSGSQPNNEILSDRPLGSQPNNEILTTDQPELIRILDDFEISDIYKAPLVNDENFLTSHFTDSFTQTCPKKTCNRRTIFGKPFEHNYILSISNATVQMPNSDVKMTLPQSVLRHREVEVNSTSFKIVSQLRKKLGLDDKEAIASPVVEYAVTGKCLFPDYAVVVIPFIGPTNDLKVRKFQSDEGLNTVVNSTCVPLQKNPTGDPEAFYIIKDSEVYIYTKSFSGFYCTTCRHRPLRLRCFLFGSYKRFTYPLRHEVRVMIYLADELMKFSDYKERMLTNETAEGRVLKKEKQLLLPSELSEKDEIQASVTPTESHNAQWIHKLYPGERTPIYDELQTVTLEYVAEKCKICTHCHLPEHDIPHGMEWYLTNVDGVLPSYAFQCIVNVDIVSHVDAARTCNRIVIDELQLRQEDRVPIEEEYHARCIRGIKEFLAGSISDDKRNAVLSALLSKYSCSGSSVEEVFVHLLEKLTAKGVLEAVVNTLKSYQMFEELDTLDKYGFVSRGLAFSALSPVNDAMTEETDLHEEPTTEVHGEPTSRLSSNGCSEESEVVPSSIVNLNNTRKPACVQESAESGHCKTKNTVRHNIEARPELSRSRTLQTTCFSKSAGDLPNIDGRDARGELTTRSLSFIPNIEFPVLPVEENVEDTIPKTAKRRTE